MASALAAWLRGVGRSAVRWGVDPRTTVQHARSVRWIHADREEYERQRRASADPGAFPLARPFPIGSDRDAPAGSARGQYFHQDLLVAQEIFGRAPRRHIDVGSRVDGFVAHVAAFRTIEVYDIRPLGAAVPGITFVQCDVLADAPRHVADSVSCLHALEHFGLGRYGDRVSYDGWRQGLDAIAEMVEPGGTLYVSVPTGEPQRVEFNAHRVFSLPFLRDELDQRGTVERLAFVTDDGDLLPSVDPHGADADRSFGAHHGCSIWVLRVGVHGGGTPSR